MNECWADPLGDCKGKISQEHTVTEGVLAETIAVEGFKWCKPEPKEIRREKLTRPILCEGHNNVLSLDVDPAGVTFMDTFGRLLVVRSSPRGYVISPVDHRTAENKRLVS